MLSIIDNNYVIIIIVFFSTIAILIFFGFMIDFVKNKLSQSYLKKQQIKDIDNVESKIYELLYSKKEMKFVDINSYFNMDDKQLNLILEDLISKNVIECINDSYKLKSE